MVGIWRQEIFICSCLCRADLSRKKITTKKVRKSKKIRKQAALSLKKKCPYKIQFPSLLCLMFSEKQNPDRKSKSKPKAKKV